MASATTHPNDPVATEDEPLLGPSGSVQQEDTRPIYHNFLTGACIRFRALFFNIFSDRVTGSAIAAQAGIWVVSL